MPTYFLTPRHHIISMLNSIWPKMTRSVLAPWRLQIKIKMDKKASWRIFKILWVWAKHSSSLKIFSVYLIKTHFKIQRLYNVSIQNNIRKILHGRSPRKDWFSSLCVMIQSIILLYVLNISVIQCMNFKKQLNI